MSLLQTQIGSMVERSNQRACYESQFPDGVKTRTARLIYQIEQRPGVSTAELERTSGLHSSLVWGLLKHARATGRIEYSRDAGWRISNKRDARLITDAVALLRAHGWQCLPPDGGAAS